MQVIRAAQLAAFSLLVLVGVTGSALAFEVAMISTEELSDGSLLDFESSFCEVLSGDTVTVTLMASVEQPPEIPEPEADDVTVTGVELKNESKAKNKLKNAATPNRGSKGGGSRSATISSAGIGTQSVMITLDSADEGWHTVHVRLVLSNGDRLGVNLHSTPCEEEIDDELPL